MIRTSPGEVHPHLGASVTAVAEKGEKQCRPYTWHETDGWVLATMRVARPVYGVDLVYRDRGGEVISCAGVADHVGALVSW